MPGARRLAYGDIEKTYTVEIKDTGDHRYCARAVIWSGDIFVAEVGWTQGYGDPDEAKRKAEAIARAHLFAGASDMLAALKALVAPYEGLDATGIRKTPWPHTAATILAARAAIAKAEG